MAIERINHWAREDGRRIALICRDQPFAYGQLARNIEAVRRAIAAQVPPPGALAVVCVTDLLAAWMLVLAARALGLVTVHVSSPGQVEALGLRDVGCVLFSAAKTWPGENPGGGAARIVVPVQTFGAAEGLDASVDQIEHRPDGGHILYTSGTTGDYKKLLIEAAKEDGRERERVRVSKLTAQTVFHALDFGLWTGIGFKTCSAVWHTGGRAIIDNRPDAHANFRRHNPNYAQTLPEILRSIVEAAGPDSEPARDMVLRCGGGFTPLDLAERARARISETLLVGFSASELTASMMLSEFREPEDLIWLTPVDAEVVQIVDEDGAGMPAGQEGELRFRLRETDATGYLDDPEATARVFRDGCFYSGDIAVRRADGRVRILGRVADVINIKGQKRAVGPIEQALQQGLGVEEVCLFSGLAADGVEELAVAVRSARPIEPDEVLRRLGPSEIFDRVRVQVFADFPRTQTGTAKTRRLELRRLLFPPTAEP